MKVRLSIEYEVEDENPEIEKLGAELIRAEADALVESVKRKLRAAGLLDDILEQEIDRGVADIVDQALKFADASSMPREEEALLDVI